MDEVAIQRLIDGVAKSLSESDAAGAARWWDVPALALGGNNSVAVASIDEVIAFFAANIPWYQEKGIASVKGELVKAEIVAEPIVAATIRWPGFDAAGNEVWSETSHYLLSVTPDGEYRIRVAVA